MKRPIPDPAELLPFFRNLLASGECYCALTDGGPCLSCLNARKISRAGLDWCDERRAAQRDARCRSASIWPNAPDTHLSNLKSRRAAWCHVQVPSTH